SGPGVASARQASAALPAGSARGVGGRHPGAVRTSMIAAIVRHAASASSWRLLLVAGFAPSLAATGPARAVTAVVLNSDDDSLSVIDGDSYREISRIHIGRSPHHLMLTPDGKDLIIAMSGGNELVFIDRVTGAIKQRLEASDPYQIGFS